MANRRLQAGPFSMIYQNGFIRRLSHGDNEILRMIYFALRDEHWGTFHLHIEDEKINITPNGFSIEYNAFNKKNEQRILDWHATITGESNGTITFRLEGKVLEDTLKNRAGFCVLHPLKQVAGIDCKIVHTDGKQTEGKFPFYIAAKNPFVDIAKMKWHSEDLDLELKFEGDIFETEDQRNWTDASFKTFCTPLSKPFPAWIKKGDTISQVVTFSVASGKANPIETRETVMLKESEIIIPMPQVGIGSSSEVREVTPVLASKLNEIKFSHYRIEIDCTKAAWQSILDREVKNATMLSLPLEIVIQTTPHYKSEIETLLKLFKQQRATTRQILVLTAGALVTHQGLIDYVSEIKNQFGDIRIGAGTNFNFTEINQNRFNPLSLDFVSFSVDPQEHTFDDMSIIENIEAQGHAIESARKIYPGKQIHVSPLTLRKRNNPYTKDPNAVVMSEEQRTDPRQSEKFCGVFTLGSIKALSISGCTSVTYYQTAGKQGIISADGKAFPVFEAIKNILNGNSKIQNVESSSRLEVDGIIVFNGNQKKIIIWNYTEETTHVTFCDNKYSIPAMEIVISQL
jgi:hypothetical protein